MSNVTPFTDRNGKTIKVGDTLSIPQNFDIQGTYGQVQIQDNSYVVQEELTGNIFALDWLMRHRNNPFYQYPFVAN